MIVTQQTHHSAEVSSTEWPLWTWAAVCFVICLAGCVGSEARPSVNASMATMSEPVDGVWVHIYEDDNFAGRACVLPGPAEYSSLSQLCGRNRNGRISSLNVGPGAWVIAFHELNFEGQRRYYAPGSKVADLSDEESDDDFESIKVFNSKPAEWR